MSAAIQTVWADAIAAVVAEVGASACVISPGSRSTPLVAALANRVEVVTIIDERAAAFYALGAARATGRPAVLACTSGSAAAHYLPAIVEASTAGVPLVVLTANRPPELHDCGASQTIDQRMLYGTFVRGAFDLGAPVASELALRAVRRKLVQAFTLALGPAPGPVHVDVALRKPLEPAAPSTDAERALARMVDATREHLRVTEAPRGLALAPPRLAPDRDAIEQLARAIASEPHGVIVAGALPLDFPHDAVVALARASGYPILAEAGSQLRFCERPDDVAFVDHFDVIADAPRAALIVQLGAEPVAAAWPAFAARVPARWSLAGPSWRDPDSIANVILGDVELAVTALAGAISGSREWTGWSTRRNVERTAAALAWRDHWLAADRRARTAITQAIASYPRSETAALAAIVEQLPPNAILQVGNSLPIRVIDHVATGQRRLGVITQRGAAGIDGMIASAAGATRASRPVVLVLGDVSFAHDLGGLLATRAAAAPLAIVVIDNGGGQIFAGLPIANAVSADTLERHWLTPPAIDPAAIAAALGVRAVTAASPAALAATVAGALATTGVTVIHAPVAASGAHDVRRAALATVSVPDLQTLGGRT